MQTPPQANAQQNHAAAPILQSHSHSSRAAVGPGHRGRRSNPHISSLEPCGQPPLRPTDPLLGTHRRLRRAGVALGSLVGDSRATPASKNASSDHNRETAQQLFWAMLEHLQQFHLPQHSKPKPALSLMLHQFTEKILPGPRPPYLANSTARVSRITVTRIWPGYCISSSIFRQRLRASSVAWSSVSTSGWTKTRSSRPACTA